MRFSPMRKRVNAGVNAGGDQVGDAGPTALEGDE